MILLILAFWGFILGVPALILTAVVYLIARTGQSVKETARPWNRPLPPAPTPQTWLWNAQTGKWEVR